MEISIAGEDVTDQVAAFSSRGPTADHELAPDVVAPGVEIRSTWPKAGWEPGVFRLSGTSMAGPHVAGAAALLRQLHPRDSVATVTGRLVGAAQGIEAAPSIGGAGRLDVAAARSALTAEPTALSFGLADLSRPSVSASDTVALRNHTGQAVAVNLTVQGSGNGDSGVRVSPSRGTVPAGGELKVRVELSTRRPAEETDLSGWVLAEVAGTDVPDVRVPYLLAVGHLVVRTSPDPGPGSTSAFVWAPTNLAGPPVLTVAPPHGPAYQVTARHDHDNWWRADLTGHKPGAYQVTARANTDGAGQLTGSSFFEVLADKPGSKWAPLGPNAAAGDIATSRADPRTVAVTQHRRAGPWTSRDGGATWRQHTRLPVAAGSGAGNLVIDDEDPDTMWYAVNGSTGGFFNEVLDPTYQGRVLRTRDAGATWQTLNTPDVHVEALVREPSSDVLVSVTADALLVSTDDGDSWWAEPNPVTGDLVGAAVADDAVFLATATGLWRVRGLGGDAAASVEQVYDAGEHRLDAIVADDRLLAVLTSDDTVLASRDGGTAWTQLYQVPGGGALGLLLAGDDLVVTTYRDHQHLGRNHGASWSVIPEPVRGAIETDVAPWIDGGLLWSSEGAGLFSTRRDGSQPQRIGVQGLTAHDLAVASNPDGTWRLLAGTDSDVYATPLPTTRKLDSGVTEWGLSGSEAHVGTEVAQLAVQGSDRTRVWKIRKDALSSFWVYRSDDGGDTWSLRGKSSERASDLAVADSDPGRVVVPFWSLAGTGLFLTRDGGGTWRKVYHDQMFTTVATDPSDSRRLWLGSDAGLFRSDDFGETVVKVADGPVAAVAADGANIVAGGPKILVSHDSGKTFQNAGTGGLPIKVTDLAVSPTRSRTWYAGTGPFLANGLVKSGRGVLRSTDAGRTWRNVSRGLQNLDVESLVMSPDGQWLYAGVQDGGVHRLPAHWQCGHEPTTINSKGMTTRTRPSSAGCTRAAQQNREHRTGQHMSRGEGGDRDSCRDVRREPQMLSSSIRCSELKRLDDR